MAEHTKRCSSHDAMVPEGSCDCGADRIADLEAALRALVADCDDYARINNLSGTWATIEQARKVLG